MSRLKCDYINCKRTAYWVVETSYSPVCLCTTHIGVKYLSTAAKVKSILEVVKVNEQNK